MISTDPPPVSDSGRIAFIGGGNMARSLIGGLIAQGRPRESIFVAEPVDALREALHRDFGVEVRTDAQAAVVDRQLWVFAVKPQVMRPVCESLAKIADWQRPLVISIAAGITTAQIQSWLGVGSELPVVRAMPNTPALLGAGATGLYATDSAKRNRADAEALLSAAGTTTWIADEALMDTVTALSGSGPAYFFLLVEALEDAAVAQGLPREAARALAAQTCLGAGRMLRESGEAPATLRQRVTSPNGTTQAALESFDGDGLRAIVARAVAAATRRGQELSAQFD